MPRKRREISGGVLDKDIQLNLQGDIDRIRRFIAQTLAKQVVDQIKEEDARTNHSSSQG